jgi:hypothetical protein
MIHFHLCVIDRGKTYTALDSRLLICFCDKKTASIYKVRPLAQLIWLPAL